MLKGVGDPNSVSTPDVERNILEFALLVFCLALVWYFLIMFPFLPFGMAMYALCHCLLEACGLLFYFYFTGANGLENARSFRRNFEFWAVKQC